jgi:hypothetical protein
MKKARKILIFVTFALPFLSILFLEFWKKSDFENDTALFLFITSFYLFIVGLLAIIILQFIIIVKDLRKKKREYRAEMVRYIASHYR